MNLVGGHSILHNKVPGAVEEGKLWEEDDCWVGGGEGAHLGANCVFRSPVSRCEL